VYCPSPLLSHATSYLTCIIRHPVNTTNQGPVPSSHGDRSLSGRLFSFLSAVLCPLSSVLCPLSSVLCPLSPVLCPLSSVLCPRHRPRAPPVPPVLSGRRSLLRCSSVPRSCVWHTSVLRLPVSVPVRIIVLTFVPVVVSSTSGPRSPPRPRPRPAPVSAVCARPAAGPLLCPRRSRDWRPVRVLAPALVSSTLPVSVPLPLRPPLPLSSLPLPFRSHSRSLAPFLCSGRSFVSPVPSASACRSARLFFCGSARPTPSPPSPASACRSVCPAPPSLGVRLCQNKVASGDEEASGHERPEVASGDEEASGHD